MKKGFLGYKVSEVDVVINALREENESLNTTVTTLKTQMKNSDSSNGAKATLLEDDLKRSEELLKKSSEEKEELITQITKLTNNSDLMHQKNAELMAQLEIATIQNDSLKSIISEYEEAAAANERQGLENKLFYDSDNENTEKTPIDSSSVKEQEDREEELVRTKADLRAVAEDLEMTRAMLDQKSQDAAQAEKKAEALKAKLELAYALNDDQAQELVIAKSAIEELSKIKAADKKMRADLNQASEISFKAYYDMSRMRNDVVEYMHEQMKEYYQLVNDNNLKMRTAFEERQQEYNQMMRDFFTKTSEFRTSLSNMDVDYSNMEEYNMNIDKISDRMKEIMDNFIEESGAKLRKKEEALKTGEATDMQENAFGIHTEEVVKKPIVFKISG